MSDLNALLAQVTEEVLENMFFSGVMGELEAPALGQRLCATVTFTGSSTGELGVSAPLATATALAAGFLGSEDETVADSQVLAVVGELANVLCGVVLARMNPDGQFVISPPGIANIEEPEGMGDRNVLRCFEIMEGNLSVSLTVH
jgi:CheY-specific phosphatase CheX